MDNASAGSVKDTVRIANEDDLNVGNSSLLPSKELRRLGDSCSTVGVEARETSGEGRALALRLETASSEAEVVIVALRLSLRGMLVRFGRGRDDFELTFLKGISIWVERLRERLCAGVMGRELSPGDRQSRGILERCATKSCRGTT